MFDHLATGRWWDRAWSLVDGCTPVSPGCDHCWARNLHHRFHGRQELRVSGESFILTDYDGKWTGQIRVRDDRLDLPLRTKKPTAWAVWNDLFHEHVPPEFIFQVLEVITKAPQHIFLILTKRPERANFIIGGESGAGLSEAPLPNLWLGTTAENQEMAEKRLPPLLEIPSDQHFVSVEPMLGSLNILRYLGGRYQPDALDWVICGGESGPGARPMQAEWARSLRDQCVAAGVPFFFKQWGEFYPTSEYRDGRIFMARRRRLKNGRLLDLTTENFPQAHFATFPQRLVERCLKAGTSEKGCCPQCGAPWKRIIKKNFKPQEDVSLARGIKGAPGQKPMPDTHFEGYPRGSNEIQTCGWQTTCKCPHTETDLLPATILDPFGGSGTTGLVAGKMGLNAVLCELKPEYVAMARQRLIQGLGLLAEIEVENGSL